MKKHLATAGGALALLALLTACSPADSGSSSSTAGSAAEVTDAPSSSGTSSAQSATSGNTAIKITAGGRTIEATLNGSQVSQDFLASLPRTISANRNAGIEYIAELPKPMTETGPFHTDVQAGDIVYYNPSDSVTFIYEPTSSVPTLTKMGKVTSNLADFRSLPDSVDLRIERA